MNQKKIGVFLKELRREKKLTQEQLAATLGVTNRSVSRWENGVNLPDLDLVIELANYFDVSIEEFLDGERKDKMVNKETEQVILKAAEYESNDKNRFSRRVCGLFVAAIAAFILYGVLDACGLAAEQGYDPIATCALGLVFGALLVGALYTSSYLGKVQSFKLRLLRKLKKQDETVQ